MAQSVEANDASTSINYTILPPNLTDPTAPPSPWGRRRKWNHWSNFVPYYIRFFCFFWQFIKYSFQFILCERQVQVLNNENLRIPRALQGKLSPETFNRARKYQRELVYLEMFSCGYYIIYEWWKIYYAGNSRLWFLAGPMLDFLGFWPDDWDQETGETIIFIAEFILLDRLITLPIDLWKNFIIEEKYGFNRMDIFSYFWDWGKMSTMEVLWSVMAGIAILIIVRETGTYFFLWVSLFCFIWLVTTLTIYPHIIAPILNDYSRLREGRLRDRLQRLGDSVGFPLGDILVLHQNWKTGHRNAYILGGIMASKKIVLFDTLLAGYPEADTEREAFLRTYHGSNHVNNNNEINEVGGSVSTDDEYNSSDRMRVPSAILLRQSEVEMDSSTNRRRLLPTMELESVVSRQTMYDIGFTENEIEALLARLLGQWKLNHRLYELIFPMVSLFLFFVIFSFCYQNSSLFHAFAIPRGMDKPIILGLRLLYCDVMDIYIILVDAVMRWLARNRELEADSFATKLNYGDDLINALIELNKENLGFPYYDSWYWKYRNSEPSLLQRIEGIQEEMKKME